MRTPSYKKYVEANEKAWDEVTPIHQSYRAGEDDFFRKGGCTLDRYELENLPDLTGKKVAHLCCNCGQDTLSLSNLGALCTGFDQSELVIKEAIKLSEDSGVKAEFVRSNVLEISEAYHNQYDLVYLSIGVLVWIPDIPLLMKNASNLLKKGGELFIYDQHPFEHLFDPEGENPLEAKFNYFETEPNEYRGLDYLGGTEYKAKPNYQYMVRLGDILNGIANNGLRLTKVLEFNHSIEDSRPSNYLKRRENTRKYFGVQSSKIPKTVLIRAIKY